MQDELLKSFDGKIMFVTKRYLLLLGPVQFYLAGMSTVTRTVWDAHCHCAVATRTTRILLAFNTSSAEIRCQFVHCSISLLPALSWGMITSMEGQDKLSTDGNVLSIWTFRILPVTALRLSGVIKKGISNFTIFPQYLPHITL